MKIIYQYENSREVWVIRTCGDGRSLSAIDRRTCAGSPHPSGSTEICAEFSLEPAIISLRADQNRSKNCAGKSESGGRDRKSIINYQRVTASLDQESRPNPREHYRFRSAHARSHPTLIYATNHWDGNVTGQTLTRKKYRPLPHGRGSVTSASYRRLVAS